MCLFKAKFKNICIAAILIAQCFMFVGCGSSNPEGEPETTQTLAVTSALTGEGTPRTTEDTSMYEINPLTGVKNMDKSNAGKRPVAVTISNINKALPQAGITECDMFFEIPAEGGITRIMGLFADVSKIPTLGPIRSARDYYVAIAHGYNAVYAHYGTSTTAKNAISKYSVNNLDGMSLSSTFWRDPVRKSKKGLEHSAMTSGEKLAQAISQKKFNMNTGMNGGNAFKFYPQESFTADGTADCKKITAKFSGLYTAEFNYDTASKLYGKSQLGAAHVDENGKQIKVTNVIVIYTKMTVVSTEGHLSLDLSSGKGYCFSAGKSKEIKWSKGEFNNPIKFYNTDGTDLTVNAGKTYVCIVDSANKITMS